MQHAVGQAEAVSVPIWAAPVSECSKPIPAGQSPDSELQGRLLLLVVEGRPGRWRLLKRLRAAGVRLACYTNTQSLGWAGSYVAGDHWVSGPLDDYNEAICRVRQWQGQQPGLRAFDGILCYDEYGIELTAALAQGLGLQYLSPEVAASIRCKYTFRDACHKGGFTEPRYVRVDGPSTAHAMTQRTAEFRYPVVVKPLCCAGSFSVVRCDTPCDLATASNRYFDALPGYLESFGLRADAPTTARWGMIVEELVVGDEVDIDCVVVEGKLVFAVVSDNHPQPTAQACTTFMERGGRCPSVLPQSEQASLLRMARDVVSLWGPGLTGVFHLEALSTRDRGPVPIELNGRIGGAETYTNVLAAWGVDLVVQAARLALGLAPHIDLPHAPSAPRPVAVSIPPLRAMDLQNPIVRSTYQDDQHDCSAWSVMQNASAWQPAATAATSRRSGESTTLPSHVDTGSSLGTPTVGSSSVSEFIALDDDQLSACSDEQHHVVLVSHPGGRRSPPQSSSRQRALVAPEPPQTLAVTSSHVACQPRLHQSASAPSEGQERVQSPLAKGLDWVVLTKPLVYVYSVNFVPEWRGVGVLEEIDMSHAVSHPHFVDLEVTATVGSVVKLPPAGYSGLGWMVARGDTAQDAEEAMQQLMSGVAIRVGCVPDS